MISSFQDIYTSIVLMIVLTMPRGEFVIDSSNIKTRMFEDFWQSLKN